MLALKGFQPVVLRFMVVGDAHPTISLKDSLLSITLIANLALN